MIQKDFIWRARRPKIKHSTLIGFYTNGGYKDVDIESKLESLKIIWIRHLLDSNFHSWTVIPQCLLSEIGIQSIFHSNFKPSEIWQLKIVSYPKFYNGLISFWETACTEEPSNLREITSQTIWNNYYISKQGNTLFNLQLCYKGIQYVRDIPDDHGKIMNWQAARPKFDLHDKDFMLRLSLLKSIPFNWKRKIEATDEDIGPAYYDNPLPIMTVKHVYLRMLQPLIKQPTSQKKIRDTFSQSQH